MRILIDTIPHEDQRYPTVGDWQFTKGDFGRGEDMLDKFDKDFDGEGEPGDDPTAPYHREHVFATKIERMLAEELGIDWDAYDKTVNAL
jgi:hypothetical protein